LPKEANIIAKMITQPSRFGLSWYQWKSEDRSPKSEVRSQNSEGKRTKNQ